MYKKVAAAVACGVVAIQAGKPDYDKEWSSFKKKYNKNYDKSSGMPEEYRFNVFKENMDHIMATNAKNSGYTLAINEFSDWTSDEFFRTHLGFQQGGARAVDLQKVPFPNITDVADSVDWVAKGAVTPVKNQAQCGSCWAFSSTGSIEGAYFVSSGKLVSLSEEDLVQCDKGGHGCQGGLMDQAFEWVSQNGIAAESAYPYTSGAGVTGRCNAAKQSQPVVTLTGHTDVPSGNEEALKAAVSKQPVSIAIEADKAAFQSYSGGILDNPACGKNLDHGVLIVGYGTDGGKDYWKVKNSWGANWGEEGYIRMVRGKDQCGLATEPSYPTGVKAASGPSPGPSPPSPSPPSPSGAHHYEDPKGGCRSDEIDIQIQGVSGSICTPACPSLWPIQHCTTDVPDGVTAKPQCALQDASSKKRYCALICSPGSNGECGPNASCKSIQGTGICTYDDAKDVDADATFDFIGTEVVV